MKPQVKNLIIQVLFEENEDKIDMCQVDSASEHISFMEEQETVIFTFTSSMNESEIPAHLMPYYEATMKGLLAMQGEDEYVEEV